ncbi:TPA: 3-dehydroquinate synthase [Candidatus Gracilibacteria bacterium]|nr:3-dehydroquinate synthase [Candidatus Peregrinibacteria bacterium]HIQ56551.1 3-dehydroquinate synthase [Candidatus Gracilibacteria bacterium]HIQ57080.1 3-dehydroquinate synthase [Candidatus Gracilibacteria bacterium]
MKIDIHIETTSKNYTINFFTENNFENLYKTIESQINNRNCLFVTDENIFAKTDFFKNLEIQNKNIIVLPAGEKNKTWESIEKILDACFQHNLDRSSCLISVGGGVIGDMTGFASSIFMRGIPFIQVPTTLLSMVDSSVGGKTGIDTPHGKNLIGAFHQPEVVFCCKSFLSTLECIEIQNGLSEMIKHGILGNKTHFKNLENLLKNNTEIFTNTKITEVINGENFELLQKIFTLVPESISVKKHIIQQDETEQFGGVRGFLNLGHTYGHAIELLSNFQVPHGIGVAKGIICALKTSQERNIFENNNNKESSDENRIKNIFEYANINTSHNFSDTEMEKAMMHDKKKKNGKIQLILIKKIGEVTYDYL